MGITNSARPYVDGEWRETDSEIAVSDLAEGGEFATVSATDTDLASEALAAAERAKSAMRQTTVVQRAEWAERVAVALRDRKDELAEIIVREAGKPIGSALGEVDAAATRFELAAEEVRALHGEYREGATAGHEGWEAIVKPEPMGAVLCISPYNYPLTTTAQQVAPALVTGNSVLLKPATATPISGSILADVIAAELDLPDGAFNFVPGRGSEIGDTLSSDERLNVIAMTGSTRAGKRIARESGMVELHLELGGNAPAIVFPDADITDTVEACTMGSVKYGGQRCSAVSRILAHESVHDEVAELIDERMASVQTGDLFDEATTFGPLISEDQAEWVQGLVDDAVERGADLLQGGSHDGVHFEPTVLANVPQDARIVHEEQFGPVAAITTFSEESEAVDLANESDLALDASVFTNDYDRALRVANRVDAGAVRINGRPSHGLGDVPYGGNKDSGIGREGLQSTIESMVRTKSIIL